MTALFYMGCNTAQMSGVSFKMYEIGRRGKVATASWGPAIVVDRRVVSSTWEQTKTWTFKTEEEAAAFVESRIAEKLAEGYERTPVSAMGPKSKGNQIDHQSQKRREAARKAVLTKGKDERKRAALMAAWTKKSGKNDKQNPFSKENSGQ